MKRFDVTFFKNNKIIFLVMPLMIFSLIFIEQMISRSDLSMNLFKYSVSNGELKITELMTDNSGAYSDDDGNVYDWIEIYNGTDKSINLANYGLSDSADEKVKWLFPDYTIESHGYLVVYLAGIDADGMYANFSLKKAGGETVILTNPSGTIIDEVVTKKITKNNSMSLNEKGEFFITTDITPGYSNDSNGRESYLNSLKKINNELIITEILPNNRGSYLYDNDLPSYIELKNISDNTINLNEYSLSNDISKPFLWNLPDYELKAGEVYLIYADALDNDNHASFDLKKQKGSVYLSHKNKIIDEVIYDNIPNGMAYILNDDKFVVSSNISPGYNNDDAGINNYMSNYDLMPNDLVISEVMTTNNKFLAQNGGKYYSWIELYNNTEKDINLKDYFLSTEKDNPKMYALPNVVLKKNSYYILITSGDENLSNKTYKHANFKLSNMEGLYLYHNNTIVDSLFISDLSTNYSYGRGSKYGHYYFDKPTPNTINNSGFIKLALAPEFSIEAGKYDNVDKLEIELSGNGTIYYTLDGSTPTLDSKVYSSPIILNKTATIKAIVYQGKQKSLITTHTYIINENHTLPVLSLTIKDSDLKKLDTNFMSESTYPVHAELLDNNSKFSVDCGIKVFGGESRMLQKKSYSLKFSSKYGVKSLKYKIFDNRSAVSYDTLVLRSGSQDMNGTMFKDELVTSIIDDYSTLDVQANKPIILYVNDKYYGIYYIREKIDSEFIKNHYNVNTQNTNIVRIDYDVTSGSSSDLKKLNNFVSTHDMSDNNNYQKVKDMLDINSYLDLWIAKLFTGDYDVRNIRYFNDSNIDNGKLKLIAYDFDFAFYSYPANYFTWMTTPGGMGYYKIDNNLMIQLLKNKQFRMDFIERLSYNLNNVWNDNNIKNNYDEYYNLIKKEIKRDRDRWKFSYSKWENDCDSVKTFLMNRRKKIISQAKNFFGLSDKEVANLFK